MRIWSIHPKYLDSKGLVALWRETLLAKNVLGGNTRGYKHHPQLKRFKKLKEPLDGINHYLSTIFDEATARGYKFNSEKINPGFKPVNIPVTIGQVNYETYHLLKKLKKRDAIKYHQLLKVKKISVNPIFRIIKGSIAKWEVI